MPLVMSKLLKPGLKICKRSIRFQLFGRQTSSVPEEEDQNADDDDDDHASNSVTLWLTISTFSQRNIF